jgi:hypothetical protein
MIWRKFVPLIVAVSILGLAACGGQAPGTPSEGAIQTAIAQTDTAKKGLENAVNATLTALANGATPAGQSPGPEISLTPTVAPTYTATSSSVTMTAGQDLSCVKGPKWNLYDFVTTIKKGEIVTLLARAPSEWGEYYYVRTSNGTECWAYGGSSTKNGDTSSLPEKEAPPTPTPTKPAAGIVTHVTITVPQSVLHGPGCEVFPNYSVTITTDGPATVSYNVKFALQGVGEWGGAPLTMIFTTAGTQSTHDEKHVVDCGTWIYKVAVTSPNSMTAQVSFQVIYP